VKLAETDATAVAKAATATVENFMMNVYLWKRREIKKKIQMLNGFDIYTEKDSILKP